MISTWHKRTARLTAKLRAARNGKWPRTTMVKLRGRHWHILQIASCACTECYDTARALLRQWTKTSLPLTSIGLHHLHTSHRHCCRCSEVISVIHCQLSRDQTVLHSVFVSGSHPCSVLYRIFITHKAATSLMFWMLKHPRKVKCKS